MRPYNVYFGGKLVAKEIGNRRLIVLEVDCRGRSGTTLRAITDQGNPGPEPRPSRMLKNWTWQRFRQVFSLVPVEYPLKIAFS
jgi:hypothetical protein